MAAVPGAEAARGDAALQVPVLDAGPFRLRPFGLSDLPLIEEAAADPYIPLITTVPAAYTPQEGRAFIERQRGRAADGTGYSFAIADAASGRAVGQIGLSASRPAPTMVTIICPPSKRHLTQETIKPRFLRSR